MAEDFEEKLDALLKRDPRYGHDAYLFVFEGLRYTLKNLGVQRHVSGQELLEGIRAHALDQFGGLAPLVLSEWGVRKTDDFGEIVFNLVDHGLMGKTEHDSREDFRGVFRFDEAFRIDAAPPGKSGSP